ncbi:hypothetical protein BDQ17DRAFT_1436108 [Cyathus striatus]|nr:hypothetical protein BDQ17DRAFT_1436108 [Cyathus striatus]
MVHVSANKHKAPDGLPWHPKADEDSEPEDLDEYLDKIIESMPTECIFQAHPCTLDCNQSTIQIVQDLDLEKDFTLSSSQVQSLLSLTMEMQHFHHFYHNRTYLNLAPPYEAQPSFGVSVTHPFLSSSASGILEVLNDFTLYELLPVPPHLMDEEGNECDATPEEKWAYVGHAFGLHDMDGVQFWQEIFSYLSTLEAPSCFTNEKEHQ